MERVFSLSRDVIALAGVACKNTARVSLCAVHFDGKNAMAADGHRLAIVPLDHQALKGISLNLAEMKKPQSAFTTFTQTGENRFLSVYGPADVVPDCVQPDYAAILPTVSPETHHAIAINVELLAGLCKAIDCENKGDKKGVLTILINKTDNLAGIGVVSSNSAGIGLLMPCRPFGGAGFPGAFEKYNAISGKAAPVEETAPLSSDVAAVFQQPGEVADAFKSAEAEGEDVPLDMEDEEETEGGEFPEDEREARKDFTIRAGYSLQGETQLVQEDEAEQVECDPVEEEAQVA